MIECEVLRDIVVVGCWLAGASERFVYNFAAAAYYNQSAVGSSTVANLRNEQGGSVRCDPID